jgi:glucose-1-phosphate cytidylyltransferase
MKVAILAGGLGTRLAEETEVRPKPMVEVGNYPILWHIMKIYSHYGYKEFFIALGYRGEVIKRYFLDYYALQGSMTIDISTGGVRMHEPHCEDWKVHLIDTGLQTQTGGRIKRLEPWLKDSTFCATYGDGVSNVDIHALVQFHKKQGKIATITAVRPPARFGELVIENDRVVEFVEKPQVGEGWINGGFMVLEPEIFRYLKDDQSILERDGLEMLAKEGQLAAYRHEGFWQCMDTLRDKRLLESLWQSANAPWKVWE